MIDSNISINLGNSMNTSVSLNKEAMNSDFLKEYGSKYLDVKSGPSLDISIGSIDEGLKIDSIKSTYAFAPGISSQSALAKLQNKGLIEKVYNQDNDSIGSSSNSFINLKISPDGEFSGKINLEAAKQSKAFDINKNYLTNNSLQPSKVDYRRDLSDVFDYSKPKPSKEDVFKMIDEIAPKYNLKPSLVKGIVEAESSFNNQCISRSGAVGLIQLMPEAASEMGLKVDANIDERWDPYKNLEAGIKYISKYHGVLSNHFGSENWNLTLAAYNAGPNRVIRDGGIPNIKETQDYVRKINLFKEKY